MHEPLISSELVDDFIIVRAASFTARVQRAMTRGVLRDEGLPVLEWRLLFSVARFGTCHMAKITQKTSIDPAHGSRAVAALERKGLITRSPDPKNARRKLISLTEDGEQLFGRIWPQARATIRRITDQLDPADFAELKRLLDLAVEAAAPRAEDTEQDETEEEHITAVA